MKQRVVLGLFILLAAGILSCASPDSTKFSSAAAQGGLTEVELGRLAVQRGSNPAVKSFGQRMIEDHSRANDELQSIAMKKSINLPTDQTFHANKGTDADIKAFAAKTLPMIQRHLQMARDVANQVATK